MTQDGIRSSQERDGVESIRRRSYLRLLGSTGVGLSGAGAGVGSLAIGSAVAAPTTIDDYDDGSLSEYTTDDSAAFDLVSSPTHSGSYAFRAKAGDYGTDYAIAMPADVPEAPQAGDTFWFYFYPEQATSDIYYVIFGAQGDATTKPASEQYWIRTDSDGVFKFYVHDGSDWTELASDATVSYSIGAWNKIEVDWGSNGSFTITHYDSTGSQTAQLSATDTTYTSGGFGYMLPAAATADRYYDTWQKSGSGGSGGSTVVLDDFEDGDLSEYAGTTDEFTVEQSSAMEGSYRLKSIESYCKIAGSATSPRGYEYECRFIAGSGSSGKPSLLVSVQNRSAPLDDCYWLVLDVPNDELGVLRRENASSTYLATASQALSEGTEYRGKIQLASDTVKGVLYDASGTKLAETAAVNDSTFSGGYFGIYTGGSPGYPSFFDYVTKSPLDSGGGSSPPSGSTLVIDDFADGDLSEYEFENGNDALAAVVSSPTHHGQNALELSGGHFHLNCTDGLQNYPRAGDVFSGWIRGSADIDGSLVLLYGVQDFENRYYAYVHIADGEIRIRKKESGSIETLASQTGLGLSTETWYEIEVDWGTDGTHVLTLYDTGGTQRGQVSTGNETTWTSGGIGYNAHTQNGANGYFDYVAVSESRNLGSFDVGLDGWTPTGSSSLGRVSGSQEPAAVTEGDHALEVTVNGDSEPIIQNEKRIRHAALSNHPCLLSDVLPSSIDGSDSAVTFRFRYHHTDPGGVEESPEMTVAQRYGGQICWDLSGLSATKLANPDRLEIAWYPEDHPPSSGFDYNGVVYVDNVRLTDDRNQVTHARCMRKHRDHERAYGPMIDQVIQSETDTTQDGVYEHHDGTQISYHVEILSNGNIQETCDGETFTWEVSS